MKRIEDLWLEVEEELAQMSPGAARPGLLTKLATSESGQRLRVGVEWPSLARVLMFSTTVDALPPRSLWPECRGLELDSSLAHQGSLIVRLRDQRCRDVFAVLAEDLARRAIGGSEKESAKRVLAAVARWQRFLASKGRALSDEERRGLWGELWILERFWIKNVGPQAALAAWRGPGGAPQDFQLGKNGMEIKTYATPPPVTVRISSERQLYNEPWQNLFLVCIGVQEQDGIGETLPQRVSSVRALVAGTAAEGALEDSLADAGWLEVDCLKHQERGFMLHLVSYFRVSGSFPRITPNSLPAGLGGVAYDLSLDAASGFAVDEGSIVAVISQQVV